MMVRVLETESWNGNYIQNGVMHIEFDRGHMNINVAWFFPCGRATWNKLHKTMQLDWKNYPEMLPDLEAWMKETIKEAEFWMKGYTNKWNEYHQKACDLKRIINEKKLPNGVPISKDDLKKKKEEYKDAVFDEKEYFRQAQQYKKLKERLEIQVERDIKPCKLAI